jgi:hypothetical protein
MRKMLMALFVLAAVGVIQSSEASARGGGGGGGHRQLRHSVHCGGFFASTNAKSMSRNITGC